MIRKLLTVGACLCMIFAATLARGEVRPLTETARKTLRTYEKALISISGVLKLELSGIGTSDQEQKTQCGGVIIDSSGLAVTSLTSLDPQSILPKLRRGGQTVEFKCQIQDVKYELADNTEVLARVVLKDEELDLAFLAPQKPLDAETQKKIAVLSLDGAAPAAELLDATILLSRGGEELNYAPTLDIGRITAVLSKPKTCYQNSSGTLGMPVFDRQGRLLGIECRCLRPDSSGSDGFMKLASLFGNASHLVLPAADVAKLVPQAKDEMKKPTEGEKN
jgi:hypothetical protein